MSSDRNISGGNDRNISGNDRNKDGNVSSCGRTNSSSDYSSIAANTCCSSFGSKSGVSDDRSAASSPTVPTALIPQELMDLYRRWVVCVC